MTYARGCYVVFHQWPSREYWDEAWLHSRAGNQSFATALPRAKMEQPTRTQSWVQVLQHRQWGFDEPRGQKLLRIKKEYNPDSKNNKTTYYSHELCLSLKYVNQSSQSCEESLVSTRRNVILPSHRSVIKEGEKLERLYWSLSRR